MWARYINLSSLSFRILIRAMKLTCTLNIITVLLRILYRRHLNMLCGIIWAVCEIRTYFTFVSNYFLAFHVLRGKVLWLTQSRMVSYIRQASCHLNISHKGRTETTIHLFVMIHRPSALWNVAKCHSVFHQLHFSHLHSCMW